jgi:hypothetical protein
LRYIPLEKDRVPAFINAAVSYAILMGMLLQAFITKLQWKAMGSQESRMIEQRDVMQGQLDAMRETINQSREIFELSQRPMLTFAKVRVADAKGLDKKSLGYKEVAITVKNVGNRPALILADRFWMNFYDAKRSSVEPNPEPEDDGGMSSTIEDKTAITPQGSTVYYRGIPTERFKEIVEGKVIMYVYLWISYEGGKVGKTFSLERYFEYDPVVNALNLCSTHHYAD